MKILFLADEESKKLWDFFRKEDFEGVDLIISCGDLRPEYLSFLATMVAVPVLYIRGNHDDKYDRCPPEGCICIEDQIYNFEGVRILGLGGSYRYKPGKNQYTENEMKKRVSKLFWKLKRHKGFDILVTHSPAFGVHDGEDQCHRGFDVFNRLIETYHPRFFVHGHVHMNYGRQFPREDQIGQTRVINAYEKYMIEI
ncbi:MAG: metallophosphoesterase [Lachnospiraceae bacterium]|nr:metallophosphoesterase [Agathobacter sp.]MDD6290832.1 metallophosphoesterase [Lachnospiraceae bacterium]